MPAPRKHWPPGAARIEQVEKALRNMTAMPSLRLSIPFAAILLAAIGCGAPARAQTIAVMVNGEPITNMDVEQRSKLNFMTTRKQQNRQEVINELIDEKVKIKEAKKFGVDLHSILENLKLTPAERFRRAAEETDFVYRLRGNIQKANS